MTKRKRTKHNLNNQIRSAFYDKRAFGQSKHEAKKIAKENENYKFGDSFTNEIFSIKTHEQYQKIGQLYADFLVENGAKRYTDFKGYEHMATAFYEHCKVNLDYSAYSLPQISSALNKLYDKQFEYDTLKRDTDNITRSRTEKAHDNQFSLKNNSDLIAIADATGVRRADLANARYADFKYDYKTNLMYLDIQKSKGGRSRKAVILPSKQAEVERILAKKMSENIKGTQKLFTHVHNKMDVHSYRRKSANDLFKEVEQDKDLKDKITDFYKRQGLTRNEDVKSEYYVPRRTAEQIENNEKPQRFNRDSLFIVSQFLGHNRLDVSYKHYLK